MAMEGHLYGERVWFHDARGHVRRMGVSTHPADSTIVISLWQGDTCTGTFRLPANEGARLVATLAYGMVAAHQTQGTGPETGSSALRGRLMSALHRFLRRTRATTETHLRLIK